jgi:excisionase family DNA binding protein
MNSNYKTRKEACEILGIHYLTLYKIAKNKEIDTVKIGQRQLYDIDKYLREKNIGKNNRKRICYCRVSSQKQKEDLKRQIKYMEEKYPTYEIISDIASGLNFNRQGLNKIIDYAIKGEIEVVVISYKDRLARFGYELIEKIIREYSKGEIKIINKKEEETPQEEISKDILAIMNVYVAKVNGLRKYKKNIKDEIKNMNGGNKKN